MLEILDDGRGTDAVRFLERRLAPPVLAADVRFAFLDQQPHL